MSLPFWELVGCVIWALAASAVLTTVWERRVDDEPEDWSTFPW